MNIVTNLSLDSTKGVCGSFDRFANVKVNA